MEKQYNTPFENQLSAHVEAKDNDDPLLLKREEYVRGLNKIDEEIKRINDEYKAKLEILNSKKRPLEEALAHIEALLKLEGLSSDINTYNKDKGLTYCASSNEKLTDIIYNLMEKIHKPMHYKELALKLKEDNVYIPGKDSAATLLSRISRDGRFKRTKKRGVYALSNWRAPISGKRSRKSRRQK